MKNFNGNVKQMGVMATNGIQLYFAIFVLYFRIGRYRIFVNIFAYPHKKYLSIPSNQFLRIFLGNRMIF